MKRFIKVACLAAFSAALASGCASNPGKQADAGSGSLPDWVMNPAVEDGIAATECVRDTGNFSLDRAEATAKARASLVKEIEIRVQAMDKTYMRSTTSGTDTESGGTFESVSRQVADQHMTGSRPLKVDYVNINDRRNLCVLVALNPAVTKDLFDAIIKQSKRSLSPTSEAALYEEFRASKAQQELMDATSR